MSNSTIDTLRSIYTDTNNPLNQLSYQILQENIKLNNGNAFIGFFDIDLTKEYIEYPVMCKGLVEYIVSSNIEILTSKRDPSQEEASNIKIIDRIVYNLYNNNLHPEIKRTFNNVIKHLFAKKNFPTKMCKVELPSGEIFYGAAGLLMDENYDILLLCTQKAHIEKKNQNFFWVYDRSICYVAPKIIINRKKNLVYKGIVDRLIPYYNSYSIHPYTTLYRFQDKDNDTKVRIIIDDIQSMLLRPKKPTPDECTTEKLNKLVLDSKEDLFHRLLFY